MAITDEHGNKIPQPRIGKKEFSQIIRNRRVQLLRNNAKNSNAKYCDICGFSVRSVNHETGKHHTQAANKIEG